MFCARFLCHYIPNFKPYVGKDVQVREVWTTGDDRAAQRKFVMGIMGSEKIDGFDSSYDNNSDETKSN